MKPVSWKGLSRVALVSALLTLSIGRSWGAKDIGPQEYTGEGSAKQATDFKNPLRVPNKPNTYHVTICDNNSWTGVWYPPEWKGNTGRVKGNSTEKDHGHAKEEDGTGGGVQMMGSSVGTTDVALTKENGQTVHLIIRVIHCDNSNKGHRGVTENSTALPTGNVLERLIQDGQVKIDNEGTGETIGHVADLKIDNVTDQPVNCVVPPMVLGLATAAMVIGLVDLIALKHSEVTGLELSAASAGRKGCVTIAATEAKDLGEKCDRDETTAMSTGKPFVEHEPDGFDVTAPLHDASGKLVGTIGIDFKPQVGQTKADILRIWQ